MSCHHFLSLFEEEINHFTFPVRTESSRRQAPPTRTPGPPLPLEPVPPPLPPVQITTAGAMSCMYVCMYVCMCGVTGSESGLVSKRP